MNNLPARCHRAGAERSYGETALSSCAPLRLRGSHALAAARGKRLNGAHARRGDLCDFYFLDGDWLCFLIGDVSGKGIPAALFMAVTKTLLKASSSPALPLAQMMAQVNDELCEQTDSGMFVSLLYGLLHTGTGALTFCHAGHPSPFFLRASGQVESLEGERDVALGAMAHLAYHANTAQCAPGDTLFLYTDGVTEALDRRGEFYTPARLQIVLKDVAPLPVEKITRGVVRDVRAFSGEHPQSDDISVMAVRWLGPAPTLLLS